MELLSLVASKYGDEIDYIENCNGCWATKTGFFNIKRDNKFYCNNYTNIKMNTRHVVWNNKKVCINCICIGNRIFATRFYYKKILHQIVEDSNLYYDYNTNFLTDFNNFVRLLQSKLSKLSLHNTNLDNVYLTIIESYKYFYKNENILRDSINKFIISNIEDNYKEYNAMKRLLEKSSYKC